MTALICTLECIFLQPVSEAATPGAISRRLLSHSHTHLASTFQTPKEPLSTARPSSPPQRGGSVCSVLPSLWSTAGVTVVWAAEHRVTFKDKCCFCDSCAMSGEPLPHCWEMGRKPNLPIQGITASSSLNGKCSVLQMSSPSYCLAP